MIARTLTSYALAAALLMLAPARAEETEEPLLKVERAELVQGGYVLGRLAPGATARLEEGGERSVVAPVGPDGWFMIGFDRDSPSEAVLVVDRAGVDGHQEYFFVEPRAYDVQRIDGLPDRQVTPRSPEDLARIRADGALKQAARSRDNLVDGFRGRFLWPVKGPVTGSYGSQRILNGEPRRPHYGVDIAAPAGTPVKAPAAGVVTLAEEDMFFEGGLVFIDHGAGLTSALLHLSDVSVAVGDRVAAGAVVGAVGSTGRSTGAHLDWRMSWRGRNLDPGLFADGSPEG